MDAFLKQAALAARVPAARRGNPEPVQEPGTKLQQILANKGRLHVYSDEELSSAARLAGVEDVDAFLEETASWL
jgi:hypothetical protein